MKFGCKHLSEFTQERERERESKQISILGCQIIHTATPSIGHGGRQNFHWFGNFVCYRVSSRRARSGGLLLKPPSLSSPLWSTNSSGEHQQQQQQQRIYTYQLLKELFSTQRFESLYWREYSQRVARSRNLRNLLLTGSISVSCDHTLVVLRNSVRIYAHWIYI